jgi:PKD repeat protein
MTRPSRTAKRLLLAVLLAATFVGVQVVLAAPPQPSFSIVGPNFTTTCGLYTFVSQSTDPDDDIDTTAWDLAGTAATGSSVTATFANPGARTINMSVTDTDAVDGTVDTVQATPQTVTVGNGGPPNAAFTANNNSPQPNETVTFNAGTSSAPGGGSITRYQWDLGGTSSTDYETDGGATATVTQAFATTGFHPVNLKVTDNCGQTDTVTGGGVFVNNTPPTSSFTVTPSPAAIGATVTFDGSASSDPGGAIANYAWDFGDGTASATNAGATITHPYATAGNYIAQLTVTDGNGASTTTFRQLRVNAKPVASFSYSPLSPLIGEQVTFDGTTSADPDGTIATYAWDLDGDGTFESAGANPTHTYNAAATVNVKLRVTDSDNTQSDVVTRAVTIQATRPSAGFSYAPHDPLPGQAVTLTSTSAPSASPGAPSLVATQWDFAYSPLVDFTLDGAGASVVTSFSTAGPHPVAVKVTESGGGNAVATDTIVVNAPPQASFTVAPAKPVEGKQVTFASTSGDPDGALAKQEWDLNNDGKYERSGAVVSTSSLKKGTRLVRLLVTDSKGATATSLVPVKVAAKPLKPAPDINSTVSWSPRAGGITLLSLTVKVPSNTSVAVSCKGGGCPRGTFHKHSKKKRSARLTFGQFAGKFSGGAKISVIFKRPGYITGWDTITILGRGKDRIVQREGCKLRAAKKQKRCP